MATVTSLSQKEFKRLLSEENVVLVELYAKWCRPCQSQAVVVDGLAEAYASIATFIRVDIDRHENIAMGLGIQSIPTVIVFRNGSEVCRLVGVQPADTLRRIISSTEKVRPIR